MHNLSINELSIFSFSTNKGTKSNFIVGIFFSDVMLWIFFFPMLFINDEISHFLKAQSWFLNIFFMYFNRRCHQCWIVWILWKDQSKRKTGKLIVSIVLLLLLWIHEILRLNSFSFFLQFLQHVCSLKTSLVRSSLTIIKITKTIQIGF